MTTSLEASKYLKPPKLSLKRAVKVLEDHGLVIDQNTDMLADDSSAIVIDSRLAEPGCLYIAISGHRSDGHHFIKDVAATGVGLVIVEKLTKPAAQCKYVHVRSTREAWAYLCAAAWDNPQEKLNILGVTGTNGKTSTVWMIKALFESSGLDCATIGTLGLYLKDRNIPTTHTTPDPDVLYGLMQMVVDSGVKVLAMEVASHSLYQKKVSPIRFSGAAFTNFTQDHLDLHKTMENYLNTKLELFRSHLKENATTVVYEEVLTEIHRKIDASRMLIYGENSLNGLKVSVNSVQRGSTDVSLTGLGVSVSVDLPFIGNIFALNFAAAFLLVRGSGLVEIPADLRDRLAKTLKPVPGRMSPVLSRLAGRPLVLVDYSHTPDALEKALTLARTITQRRLICVFGCGGERDPSKRPLMGRIAENKADVVYVTSDNPRREDPMAILNGILSGMSKSPRVQVDRRQAIKEAISQACNGDTVLIAGKGHETYQVIGAQSFHFSDEEEAIKACETAKRWCVVGGGVSGAAAAVYLAGLGDAVQVSDNGKLAESVHTLLKASKIKVLDGGHEPSHLEDVDSVVLSPGVSHSNLLYGLAAKHQLGMCTEIDLGLENCPSHIVGVTGTNGKSTTCSLLEHVLKEAGYHATACGNIGIPPTSLRKEQKTRDSYLVCELSSYQLEESLPVATSVAMITSFSFDHISRHGTLNDYFDCKWSITSGLKPDGLLILRGDVFARAKERGLFFPKAKTIVVHDQLSLEQSTKNLEHWWIEADRIVAKDRLICQLSNLQLVGLHNFVNAAFVLAAASHLTKTAESDLGKHLSGFRGLPYRCEIIGKTILGRPVINDSKSTNVESTLVALSASGDSTILLLGGAGKGESFKPILECKHKLLKVLAFGASRLDIKRDLEAQVEVSEFESLEAAVASAVVLSQRNRAAILLSPGCASFDEFKNYEHRGAKFNEWFLAYNRKE